MPDWRGFVRQHLLFVDLEELRGERIAEELALQLEDMYEEALARGLSPEEAEDWTLSQVPDWELFSRLLTQAERQNLRPAAEVWMETSEERLRTLGRRWRVLADLIQDIRFTLRSVRSDPAFWAITVLILGLGIGATTTIFSVVNGVLLKRLPYEEPEQIVFFEHPAFSTPRFVDWEEHSTSFECLAGVFNVDVDYTGGERPMVLHGGLVTPDYFELFGARTALGRLFTDDDFTGPPTRAILGFGTWQSMFGGDPGIIGRTLTINGMAREVVGILDRSFTSPRGFTGSEVDVWLAMDPRWGLFFDPGRLILTVFGRVRPGLSIRGTQDELNRKIEVLAREKPANHTYEGEPEPLYVELSALQIAMVGDTRTTLLMLFGAVTMLLLIAAANVANIFLARGIDRTSEVGIRTAMGAGRGRIVSQLLTESSILGLSGGVLGTLLAFAGVRAFEILNPGNIPLVERIAVDWRVLLFAGSVSLLTGLLFGSVPALQAARLDISSMMRDGLRGGIDRDRGRLRNMLMTVEIALALILLAGAGLLFNSFLRLQSVDPGFDPERVVGVELNVNGPRYTEEVRKEFVRRIDERLEGLPGIEGAATAITVPFQTWGSIRTGWLRMDWETPDREELKLFVMMHPATADYFSLLGAELRGRTFTVEDLTAWPVPVIVSDTFAERICPEEDAHGQTVYVHGIGSAVDPAALNIVGIVSGLHAWGLNQGSELTVYLPWERYGAANSIASLLVKTAGEPGLLIEDIREAIWAEDPDMPLPNTFVLERQISESLTVPKFYSALLVTFAVVALLLAAGGVYGAVLYNVGRRRWELSIRTALGADRASLIRLVLGRCGYITAAGVISGAIGAWLLTRFLESMVFGITTTDPVTFVTVAFLMTVVALTASWLPARKAAAADPMEALRRE